MEILKMSEEHLSTKHVTFSDEDDHIMKLEKLCERLNTDLFYGLTCKHARNLLKKEGMNKYSRPVGQEKNGIMNRFLKPNSNREWSKRDWNRVFNGRLDDAYVVIRDGQKAVVKRRELVRGDLVCLQPRQVVPADMRVISYDGELIVDNRIITGNRAECKSTSSTSRDSLLSQNMIFASTEIVNGRCDAIVLQTGDQTVFAELTQFAQKVRYVKRGHSSSLSSSNSSTVSSMSSIGSLSLPSSLNLSHVDSNEHLSAATSTLTV